MILYSNNASTTLASEISNSATTIVVATGTGSLFPTISSVDDYFNVTLTDSSKHIEIVTVTARTGDTFTVMRGMENTTARAWLASDILELRITKGLLDQLKLDATKDSALDALVVHNLGNETVQGTKTFSDGIITSELQFSGGTANGVLYLNGSKQVTSGSALTFVGTTTELGAGRFILNNYTADTDSFGMWAVNGQGTTISAYSAYSNNIIFRIGSERMRLDSSGNLGIGTSSPGDKLDVNGAIATSASGTASLKFKTSGTTNYSWANQYPSAGNFSLYDHGLATSVFTINSGSLGIGTASPASKLDVQCASGGIGFSTYSSGESSERTTYSAKAGVQIACYQSVSGSPYTKNVDIVSNADGTVPSTMRFWTKANGSSSPSERLRIDSSGNLGLGVTPSAWLAGYKAIELPQLSVFSGSGYGGIIFGNAYINAAGSFTYKNTGPAASYNNQGGAHQWSIAPSGTAGNAITFTEAMTLDASGNLGIGVTPSAWGVSALQGPASFSIGNSGNGGLNLLANAYYNAGWKYVASSYASWYQQIGGSHVWYTAPSGTAGNAITFTEAMTLDASGNLLVGKPNSDITINGFQYRPDIQSLAVTTSQSVANSYFARPNSGVAVAFYYTASGLTNVGAISISSTSTTYATSSDYRLKEDYQPVEDPIARLNQLKPINFAWKSDGSRCDGFLAHELQEVIPEAATGTKDETKIEEYEVTPSIKDEEGNVITEAVMGEREVPVYQGIDQSKIVPLLTAALQEAVAKIESLTQRIEALEYKGE